jgi:AraC family transcriptional regulator
MTLRGHRVSGGFPMLRAEHPKPRLINTADLHAQAVRRVISAVRDRLDDSISLKEMAALAYMSHFHFNRTFRQVTGLPPRRFLSAMRVEAATRLLLDTDTSVTDICLTVGYNSLGTFIRRFSSVLGISPMKLRGMRQTRASDLPEEEVASSQNSLNNCEPQVAGRIQAPVSFSGPIFVGLFATAIPEGAPLACAVLRSPGPFRVARAPRGSYYIFALGLPRPNRMDDYFKHASALRGGGELVSVEHGVVECGEISLRPAMPTDPPILVNLPAQLSIRGLRKVA